MLHVQSRFTETRLWSGHIARPLPKQHRLHRSGAAKPPEHDLQVGSADVGNSVGRAVEPTSVRKSRCKSRLFQARRPAEPLLQGSAWPSSASRPSGQSALC